MSSELLSGGGLVLKLENLGLCKMLKAAHLRMRLGGGIEIKPFSVRQTTLDLWVCLPRSRSRELNTLL